ncbi:MAG TPA: hypothetical protein VMW36_04505 [Patescibacteria group bacterium]|nr:hypothetical protein [Patescibacteria group bacterium]
MAKLLREYYVMCEGGVCQDLLTESEKAEVRDGATYLTGVMQRADAKNGNGRIYPERILRREIENYKKLINERRALGELDHPEDSVVALKNASHLVIDVWWEGKDVMGKIKVLRHTPNGQILEGLVKDGVQLGISSRGLGNVREEMGGTIVEEDFQLLCFDMVSEPSTQNAFMNLRESKNHTNIFTKADRINRLLNSLVGEF